jgi:hypothetical protein
MVKLHSPGTNSSTYFCRFLDERFDVCVDVKSLILRLLRKIVINSVFVQI